jgi:hypothetical protein
MSQPVVALHPDVHRHVRLTESRSFAPFAKQHLFPVSVHEFVRASSEFPLVFVKDSESGQFRAVALTGLVPGENLYGSAAVSPNYLPQAVLNYPLVLLANPQQPDQFSIGLNTAASQVQVTDGEALFSEGQETPYLTKRKQQLLQSFEQLQVTAAFIELLQQHELLQPQGFQFDLKGQQHQLNGIYIISEAKLNQLSAEVFADLRQRGFLPAIYAQLTSLHQLNRLAALKITQLA